MITKKIELNFYSYEELDDEAQERAVEEHKEFLDSLPEEFEDENGEMQEEYVDHDRESVEDSLIVNEYLFFKDGEMCDSVSYCGEHEKAGTIELNFKGQTHKLK